MSRAMQILAAGLALVLSCSLWAGVAHAQKKVALVVGNSAYEHTPALTNPKNDADDVAQALRDIGFDVITASDLDKRKMDAALSRFARQSRDSEVALFFYAGHGMQYQGANYLMPVDAKLEDDVSLRFEMTRLDDVRDALESARGVKIIILDACRNNPLAERLAAQAGNRSIGNVRGLAPLDRAQGMIVAYATQAHNVAADGAGRNSPFTRALLNHIKVPGLEVGTMFRRVTGEVFASTGGVQRPELSISLLTEYYLNRAAADLDAWNAIRTTRDAAQLRQFIQQHPASIHVASARQRLDGILAEEEALRVQQQRDALRRREIELRDMLARTQRELDSLSTPGGAAPSFAPGIQPPVAHPLSSEQAIREREAALREQERQLQERLNAEVSKQIVGTPPAPPAVLPAVVPLPGLVPGAAGNAPAARDAVPPTAADKAADPKADPAKTKLERARAEREARRRREARRSREREDLEIDEPRPGAVIRLRGNRDERDRDGYAPRPYVDDAPRTGRRNTTCVTVAMKTICP